MRIIRHRNIEQDDWRQLPESAAGAEVLDMLVGERVIVPLSALQRNAEAILCRTAPTGVLLRPADDVRELEPLLDRLCLVAIEFPAFNEGRGYSQARVLRQHYRFGGEIRALGDVSRDRLAFMERCGFDAFVLRPGESPEAALEAFTEISLRYQPAADAAPTIGDQRAAPGA
jgi:uncharacterized protein (DUF934 family)